MKTKQTPSHTLRILSAITAVVVASGCATTERTRITTPSGFLKDYSLLKRTKGDVAQLIYVNPRADWKRYDKILLEPVTIWRVPGSRLEDLPQNELDQLGGFFHSALREELRKDYELVQAPESGAMRLRVALTEAQKSNVAMDLVSSIIPIGVAASYGKKLATGTHAFVGKATAELEIRDARTGELLAAAVATRVGGKSFDAGKFSSWDDVREAAELWAARMRERLAEMRAGTLELEYR
jgi:hypothetical protein